MRTLPYLPFRHTLDMRSSAVAALFCLLGCAETIKVAKDNSNRAAKANVVDVTEVASGGIYFVYDPAQLEAVVGTTGGGVEVAGVTLMTVRNVRSGKEGMSAFVHRHPIYSMGGGASSGSGRFGCNSVPAEYATACGAISAAAGDWVVGDQIEILGVCVREGYGTNVQVTHPTCVELATTPPTPSPTPPPTPSPTPPPTPAPPVGLPYVLLPRSRPSSCRRAPPPLASPLGCSVRLPLAIPACETFMVNASSLYRYVDQSQSVPRE